MYIASNLKSIKALDKELEEVKLEKDELDGKLAGLLKASKNLDHLIESQRSDQVKEGVGYNDVPPPVADLYLSPKKDLSWTGLREFVDNTVTDYNRPSHTVASTSAEGQIKDSSTSEDVASPNPSKPFVKFVKPKDNQSESKTKEQETPKKSQAKYAEQYRHSNKKPKGNQRNWNNLKSYQLGSEFVLYKKSYFKCGDFSHLANNCRRKVQRETTRSQKYAYESPSDKYVGHISHRPSMRPSYRPAGHRPHGPAMNPRRPTMNGSEFVLHKKSCFNCGDFSHLANNCRRKEANHLNVKTMNKLVRHNLVRGLPTKSFDNDHTCTACLKGKQHKASCKSKSKDETSDILKKFITKIENLKDLKVKIIRCDNEGEFRNKEMNDFCSQKGIKREFSNARTPQQNGVAEMRNRTLIEAARTMLADAKLPVTFWAEAVNIACYVQNRVLVNKSQNRTTYELFNGRTPAIGFLKSFGCHVMILNTLDSLGKFEAKGDEGYFIGYSMSSKAFRVFNKRTRRVEENLHVEFLENKAIEKGTKDAANQEAKKDISSLRYIVLPNWAHDALLESSSSKPHDESSTQVSKGSGNPNPTASSSNPLADQMKTLTVESPIPTVSSPVPTACLNDSPEPSSEVRLISKRVANQEETPSLDKILLLTNRFEDILGVTTSSDEIIGVEADV
nr:hypothetical protein [Tanacetum cinerariifolium]